MLTKIKFFSEPGSEYFDAAQRNVPLDGLVNALGDRIANIRPVSGGTIGFALLAELDGRPSFLKTNAIPQGALPLRQELVILGYLYDNAIHLQKIEVQKHIWMSMDQMAYPQTKLTPDQVLAMSNGLSKILHDFDMSLLPPDQIDFSWMLRAAESALRNLSSHGMLDATIQRRGAQYIRLIRSCADQARPVLCHGDLGPLNIMLHDGAPVAIDWEDSFFGFEGYDYLYWLTFFENRKHYSSGIFGHTGLGRQNEIGIMVLILIIKSDISFRSQQYKNNKITFNQRIEEVIALS